MNRPEGKGFAALSGALREIEADAEAIRLGRTGE
jgi:hypothetical protein